MTIAITLLAVLGLLGLLAGIGVFCGTPDANKKLHTGAPRPLPALAAIVGEFADHSLVAIGESHDLKEAGDFYRALVKSPRFTRRIHAIVVEFGNARYQSLLDGYLSGKAVPLSRLRRVWQDTTQVGSWDAPMYAAFFAAVRQTNARLSPSQRVRVLLGDPPIDWSQVRRQSEWQAQARKREKFMAGVIEKDVLAEGKKALVIAGLAHVTHGGGGATDLVQSRHPKSVFVAAVHVGFPTAALERRLGSWTAPALAELAGTWIGALPYAGRRAQDAIDGLLYLGPPASLHLSVPLPTVYRDDRYWRALQARFELVNGQPFSAKALFAEFSSPPYPSRFDPEEVRRSQRFTECMRRNGVEEFPEPQAQFDAYGYFGQGVQEAQSDPDFRAAQRRCARTVFGLPPPGGG